MRSSLLALGLAVVLVLAGTALFSTAERDEAAPASGLDASSQDARVTSFDGAEIAITVYRPAGASEATPVPVVLHSHGWAGSRIRDGGGLPGKLWNAGFGVVTIDARGHGESGGAATVHHPDAEVRDFVAVLDWIHDNLAWVQREPASGIPKDLVAGGAGYSYAGGFQLMTASYDRRLDAIAPEITWSSLPDSLAPQGAPKSLWIDFLYGTAKESGTRIDARIDEWYQRILLENEVPPEAMEHFAQSSPLLDRIEADVLLVQGIPDTLFNLNHAIRSYTALSANPTNDVRLFTHLTGHVAPVAQPFGTTNTRYNIFLDEGPCGSISSHVLRWMDEKLRGGPASGIPEASFALDDGTCARYDRLPDGTVEATPAAAPAPNAAGSLLVPLLEGARILAGIPHLEATVGPLGTPTLAYAGLVIVSPSGHSRVVDDQTQPFRATPGGRVDLDLVGVAARMGPGDRLFLRVDGLNEWHLHNAARLPGASLLTDIVVTLPVAPDA